VRKCTDCGQRVATIEEKISIKISDSSISGTH
jgi:hypothetical protein